MPSSDVKRFASIDIAPDGWLVAVFYDADRGNLVMARCSGDQLSLQILDGEDPDTGADTGDVGSWASLAVDHVGGKVGVAYFDRTRGALKFAGSRQGAIQVVTVDDGATESGPARRIVGQAATLRFHQPGGSAEGLPRIAYVDATDRMVRIARRNVFGAWQVGEEAVGQIPDGEWGGAGLGLALGMGPDDTAHLAFGRWSAGPGSPTVSLELARCTPETCPAGAVP